MIKLWFYMVHHGAEIWKLTVEHIEMTAIAVGIAILIGVPLGILISYVKKLDKPIIGAANVVQAIPSMALLGLMIPLLGIGQKPAIVMVIIYSLLPIIKNTYIGIADIDPQTIESARGIGMSRGQILRKVQLPLALPVIMAGVRISAVTAVGLMTMGAFIGASGLGYMIFSGIRTVNNYQILAGAIPACILALVVDWLMGLVEKLVTPISLQKDFGTDRKVLRRKRKHQKIILITAACLIGTAIVGSAVSSRAASKGQIVIGSKDYTEQLVLCHIYSDYIEAHTNLKCVPKENLGGTQVCYEALKSGKIDMYVDYTGTLYGDILKKSGETDMDRVYQICKKNLKPQGITLMHQCAFNNTYTLSVLPEPAQKYNLHTIGDVAAKSGQLRLGTTLEFLNRNDCLKALERQYPGIRFAKQSGIDSSPRYTAIQNHEIDVTDAFATDGMLKKYHLTVMKDTDHVFPPYYAVPCVKTTTLQKYPELKKAINALAPHLTEKRMRQMNYEVDVKGRDPAEVARDFLNREGLLK